MAAEIRVRVTVSHPNDDDFATVSTQIANFEGGIILTNFHTQQSFF